MPYWRLSTFYFFYFALLGALVPYWGLFLQRRGFDAVAIGQLMAILMATKIVAPNVWGWLGDHLGHRMVIVRLASLVSLLVFLGMFGAQGFWAITLVMTLYSFFWNASLPQFEAVTFNYLGRQAARYARIRLWGSVGFIVTVVVLGALVDRLGTETLLYALSLIFVGIWFSSLSVRDPDPQPHLQDQPSLFSILRRPAILAFFGAVFLMQMSHGPYYAFYSIYMEDHGYSKTLIGQLWALGVLAEVGVFLVMHRLLLHRYFPGKLQGRGQALYASLSFGAGGAVGSLGSGFAWGSLGAPASFAIASGVALAGMLVACLFIDKQPV